MKINVIQELKNYDDKVIKDQFDNTITPRSVFSNVLLQDTPNGAKIDGQEKYKRYKLTAKINCEDSPDFKVEEIAMLKQLVGDSCSALVVGVIWDVIENVDSSADDKTE